MKNNIFTMIRRDQDGMDVNNYVDMYEVPARLLEDSNETAVLEYFSGIVADYLATEEGKEELKYNCGQFNWNDFGNIPDAFLKKYGVISLPVSSNSCAEVDANSDLVGEFVPVIYQVMDESQKTEDGKYMPDWDKLIQSSVDEEEKKYLECCRADAELRLKKGSWPAGFAFNMVYVVEMSCGHYEIFQTPCNDYYSVGENLQRARVHARNHKCTHCTCNFHRDERTGGK